MNTAQHYNFNHLSVKDLVEARDLFHIHLTNKKNVVATAIGRYLIRTTDLDQYGKYTPQKNKAERTIANSIVTSFSWPCILVFVDTWEKEAALIKYGANDIVPKTIYMPDGRTVPVCIVLAEKQIRSSSQADINNFIFPTNYIGGGFPLLLNSQGDERIATIGCIVSDGHKYYALTNRHVTGDGGEIVRSVFGTTKEVIGVSAGNHLGKINFSQIYNGWENKNTVVNCDAGLIEIDNIKRWKTDVLGIGEMGPLYDLNTNNISLGIIAQHDFDKKKKRCALNGRVKGYGAGTGIIEGEVIAMFYRYKSVGGTEYVSDFLIGGRDGLELKVHHGNSGMLWMLEVPDNDNGIQLQPLALHWGQQQFIENDKKLQYTYSLSTSLSVICRELDVDLVRGWNIDNDYSWGKVGHYTVGTAAIEAIQNKDLKKFIKNNLDNISFERSLITADLGNPKKFTTRLKKPTEGFCALADVPDIIWKDKNSTEAPWGRKGAENPNHYADVDAVTTAGKTLFDLCATPTQLTVKVWTDYYNNIDKVVTGITKDDPNKYGLISFRVWQIYDYMVQALKDKKADKFLFAAGVMTHYYGDACQPLHSSYMSDGNPKDDQKINYVAKRTSKHKDGTISHNAGDVYEKVVNPGSGVHVAYEDHMIDENIEAILTELFALLGNKNAAVMKETIDAVATGQEAGFAALTLMKKTQQTIKPINIVEKFKSAKAQGGNISAALYEDFGDDTAICLARGCRYLAAIWDSAWAAGNGSANITSLNKVPEDKLIALYREPSELPSMHLDTINTVLVGVQKTKKNG